MAEEKTEMSLGASIIVLLIFIAGLIGYINNICKFTTSDFKPSYKREIVRGVGIVLPPAGAVIGYINVTDEPQVADSTQPKQ